MIPLLERNQDFFNWLFCHKWRVLDWELQARNHVSCFGEIWVWISKNCQNSKHFWRFRIRRVWKRGKTSHTLYFKFLVRSKKCRMRLFWRKLGLWLLKKYVCEKWGLSKSMDFVLSLYQNSNARNKSVTFKSETPLDNWKCFKWDLHGKKLRLQLGGIISLINQLYRNSSFFRTVKIQIHGKTWTTFQMKSSIRLQDACCRASWVKTSQ